MCTATLSPHHILKAIQKGADGVIVAGCHIGDCHYLKGNYMTIKRMAVLKGLLRFTGFEEERLNLDWISSAEGTKFAELMRAFTEKIKQLGPSHLRASYSYRS